MFAPGTHTSFGFTFCAIILYSTSAGMISGSLSSERFNSAVISSSDFFEQFIDKFREFIQLYLPAFPPFPQFFDQAAGIVHLIQDQIIPPAYFMYMERNPSSFFIDIFPQSGFSYIFREYPRSPSRFPQAHNACFHVLCRDHFSRHGIM